MNILELGVAVGEVVLVGNIPSKAQGDVGRVVTS